MLLKMWCPKNHSFIDFLQCLKRYLYKKHASKIAMYSNAAQNYNHSLLFTLRNISFRLLHIFSSHHSVLSFSLPLWHISRNPNLFYFIALSSKSHCKKSIISEANMKWESVHTQLSILIDHEKMNSTSNTSSI